VSHFELAETYSIAVTGTAKRDFDLRIPAKALPAIIDTIYGRIAENPHRAGGPLEPPFEGYRSTHCGVYRIVYRIDEKRRVVTIFAAKPRGVVYRPP